MSFELWVTWDAGCLTPLAPCWPLPGISEASLPAGAHLPISTELWANCIVILTFNCLPPPLSPSTMPPLSFPKALQNLKVVGGGWGILRGAEDLRALQDAWTADPPTPPLLTAESLWGAFLGSEGRADQQDAPFLPSGPLVLRPSPRKAFPGH